MSHSLDYVEEVIRLAEAETPRIPRHRSWTLPKRPIYQRHCDPKMGPVTSSPLYKYLVTLPAASLMKLQALYWLGGSTRGNFDWYLAYARKYAQHQVSCHPLRCVPCG